MLFRWIFLFFLPLFAHAFQDLIFEDKEPTLYHNVNVITGALSLSLTDHVLKGPVDIPLMRTYTSSSLLQRLNNSLLQRGWNFFPQLRLSIHLPHNRHETTAYLTEASGVTYKYVYDHRKHHNTYILKGKRLVNYLELERFSEQATLFLSSGGRRIYQKRSSNDYLLTKETLPSGHLLIYTYNAKDILTKIELQNPYGTKTFSWLKFDVLNESTLSVRTSDEKQFYYNKEKGRVSLREVYSLYRPKQEFTYNKERTLETFSIEDKLQFKAFYHPQKTLKKNFRETASNTPFEKDKVEHIEGPLGTQEPYGPIASFSYHPNITDVRDADNIRTRYHYHKQNLNKIEYYNQDETLYAFQELTWEKSLLKKKALHHPSGQLILAKTFAYDTSHNIKEEVLLGNLTGSEETETFRRTYEYLPQFNVKTLETEEDGPTYRYLYLPGTNLLSAKLTYEDTRIILREFFLYNQDHLLITAITDDGTSTNPDDLTCVTERHITKYTHHDNGLAKTSAEYYWEEGKEVLLKRSEYTYTKNQLTEEKVFDCHDTYRYTLCMSYDEHGNITSKTDPLGQRSTYRFNPQDLLEEEKEIGRPTRHLSYDAAGRVYQTEINAKQATVLYDAKGRVTHKKDIQGNPTHYHYDAFSRCIATTLPEITDEKEQLYTPVIEYEYDIQGYLAAEKDPRGALTKQFYTAYGKPYKILHPDKTETRHTYNKNSTLAATTLPGGTLIKYTYDILERKTSQKTYSSQEELLSEETWEYNTFHLTAYTNPQGLRTIYIYDKAGRKIREQQEERTTLFTYDALGFLESLSDGCATQRQIHDVAGNIVEEWKEDTFSIENKTRFVYQDNKKIEAYRANSQGETRDLFSYDEEGRLKTHTDPDGHLTQFIYTGTTKTTLDALGNQTLETFDAVNRLISVEKKDPQENTHSKEQFFYDRSSNKAKIVTTLFQDKTPIKTLTTHCAYNLMGQPLTQTDSGGKTTTFEYFPLENKTIKTLPDGTQLTTLYDGLGRVKKFESSDQTVHYTYAYTPRMTEFKDHISHQTLERAYNPFGELIQESTGFSWEYDAQGRCKQMILPDASSVQYTYEGMHMTHVTRYNTQGDFVYQHTYSQFDPNGHVAEEYMICNLGTLTTQHDHFERIQAQSSPYLNLSLDYGPTHLIQSNHTTLFGKKTYTYDPLNQLQTENDQTYSFDSLGNCTSWEHSEALELKKTETDTLEYDANGNPVKRITKEGIYLYHYDALARLTTIEAPDKTIHYTYDPLSRLYSKQINEDPLIFYLYDQDKEIGTLQERKIQELKILGLGIQGEIGAAIAIELSSDVFAPLHDTSGNIIALIDQSGKLAETYNLDAFGREKDPAAHRNPWRFSSKRTEETGLVYFGFRFYDPGLRRWLTPDPSGYVEGINLYLYTLNNPLNRLDLFGLRSEEQFQRFHVEIPIAHVTADQINWAQCRIYHGFAEGLAVSYIVGGGYWHLLKFSPEEISRGRFNLFQHFNDLFVQTGGEDVVSLIHPKHGIANTLTDCLNMCQMMYDAIPERTFLLGFYTPSALTHPDLYRVSCEMDGEITDRIYIEKTFIEAITEFMGTTAKGNHILGSPHSEGGLVLGRAIELASDENKKHIEKTYLSIGLGPARPLSNELVKKAIDFYSDQDFVTGWFAHPHVKNPDYDIRFVKCRSRWSERSFYFADHAVNGATYTKAYKDGILELKKLKYRFYDGKSR